MVRNHLRPLGNEWKTKTSAGLDRAGLCLVEASSRHSVSTRDRNERERGQPDWIGTYGGVRRRMAKPSRLELPENRPSPLLRRLPVEEALKGVDSPEESTRTMQPVEQGLSVLLAERSGAPLGIFEEPFDSLCQAPGFDEAE